jgi:HD superfamily phosphohydrolase
MDGPDPTALTATAERPFVIRDPVHGYLVVAAHERLVVDHPVTQRLRRIGQTGLTEYVFPEARTSRFVHSLGAMHMASRFVLAALENADADVAERFFGEMDNYVGRYSGERDGAEELLKQDGTLSALGTVRSSFRQQGLEPRNCRQLMSVTEAGLRLAALFHDLGHLPYSHDVEYALKDFAAQRNWERNPLPPELTSIAAQEAPHEEIGHRLAMLVFKSLGKTINPAVRGAYEMATRILTVPAPKYSLRKRPKATPLQWLHSLIDGEIDADRADYLLRDGQALGLDFAHYDVDRLVSNLVLVEDADLGFVSAVKETGLPALESYCLSRSRSNQIFIRHHKVAQVSTALRHASMTAFRNPQGQELLDVLTQLGASDPDGKLLDRFAQFDDTRWFGTLRSLQSGSHDELTKSCLDLVLDRKRTLRSVWKRKGELSPEQFKRLNGAVDNFFLGSDDKLGLQEKRRQLLDQGILINAFKFKPYLRREQTDDSVMLVKARKGIQPASEASPLIKHLWDAWDKDIHIYAFVSRESNLELNEVVEAVTK